MTIADEIIACFKNAKKNPKARLSEISIIKFMLGECLENEYSKTNLKEYKKFQKNWTVQNVQSFVSEKNSNWAISNCADTRFKKLIKISIDFSQLNSSLRALIEKYSLKEEDCFDSTFKNLCAYALFGSPYPATLFPPYRHARLTNYAIWADAEESLSKSVHSNSITYIYGPAASGKTLLTQKVLKDYYPQSSDICFVKLDGSNLGNELKHIPFINEADDTRTVLSYLNKKTEHSVLIIKRPFITHEDYLFIEEHFSGLKLKTIVLTQTDLAQKTDRCISVKNRPHENFKEIYIKHRGCSDLTDNEFSTLLDIVSQNPYVLSLVARVLKNLKTTTEYNELKERFLDKTQWIWTLSNQPTLNESYHNKGHKSKQTIPRLISYILECYGCTDKYSEFSVWAKTPIAKPFLIKFTEFTEQDIESALQRGLLEYTDEQNYLVAMPSIVADSIWEQHPKPYKDYQTNLQDFFELLKSGTPIVIPYRTLYPITRALVQRFHFQVYKINGTSSPDENHEFIEWNYLLINLINRLVELGDYKIAEEFVPYILYCKQKHYKQKWEIHDAAQKSERLIRKVLLFHAKFISNGLTTEMLSELQNILKETFNLISQNDQSDSNYNAAVYFTLKAFQAFLDFEIRLDKVCLHYQALETDTFHTTYPLLIDDHLNILLDLLSIISAKMGFQEQKWVYQYYSLVKTFRSTFSCTRCTSIQVSGYIDSFTSTLYDPHELPLKARCQNLYYTLSHVLRIKAYALDFQNNDLLIWAEQEFNYLASQLLWRVYSFDTLWTLFLCMFLLTPYKSFVRLDTLQYLRTTWDNMLYLASNQITLAPKEREDLLRLISQYATQIL